MNNKFWEAKALNDKVGELFIYGEIVSSKWEDTDTTAAGFKQDLDALGDIARLNIYCNSPGGSVFEGNAIYNILKRHRAYKTIYVDGLAASIASVICMAGDQVRMPANTMMMIHNPWMVTAGNAADLRKTADDLDRIGNSLKEAYLQKSGNKLTAAKLQSMLDTETWLSAADCLQYGLCDVVDEANQVAASISEDLLRRYRNVPKQLVSQQKNGPSADEMAMRKQLVAEAKENLNKRKTDLLLLDIDIKLHQWGLK